MYSGLVSVQLVSGYGMDVFLESQQQTRFVLNVFAIAVSSNSVLNSKGGQRGYFSCWGNVCSKWKFHLTRTRKMWILPLRM